MGLPCDECSKRAPTGASWKVYKGRDGVRRCPECRSKVVRIVPALVRCIGCSENKASSEFYAHKKSGVVARCRACVLESNRIRKYGVTKAEFDRMSVEQSNRCAICRESTKLYLDHCHAADTPRGLLCDDCNKGLGMFKDDVDRIMAAAAYLLIQTDVLKELSHGS